MHDGNVVLQQTELSATKVQNRPPPHSDIASAGGLILIAGGIELYQKLNRVRPAPAAE